MYSDADVAALYDQLNGWGPSDDFYFELARPVDQILDVGCGTGTFLHRLRDNGHRGRLCGLDPDAAALDRARQRIDIEWFLGPAAAAPWVGQFDLAVMMTHAFQFLVTDDEVRDTLAAVRTALADGGRFAFETRHPADRAWDDWNPANATTETDPAGRLVTVTHRVESEVGDVIALSETTTDGAGTVLRADRASLRFLDVAPLNQFLEEAGFTVEAQYGDWSGAPIGPTSPEIITIAVRA